MQRKAIQCLCGCIVLSSLVALGDSTNLPEEPFVFMSREDQVAGGKDQTPPGAAEWTFPYSLPSDKKESAEPAYMVSFNAGVAYCREHAFDEAIQAFRESIRLHPGNSLAYDALGMVFFGMGKYGKAIENFTHALRIDPGNPRIRCNRATAYLELTNFSRATADYEEVLKTGPWDESGYRAFGDACWRLGRWKESLVNLRRAVSLEPDDSLADNNLAWLLATCPLSSIRNGEEAVKLARTACDITHWKKWNCVGTLAAAYAESGDFHSAVKFESEAIQLLNSEDKRHMGDARQQLSEYQHRKPHRSHSLKSS